ncbi:hypothetical protein [Pseudomonas putida]|uniref:Uncharacterized protein n=1 Tax=Pseudomonas putida TaxID=303 RepID=A0A8I1JHK7_PSEPU|nr:hypothetical protein [Pseudomonas putida]MBI6882786.1 hypothetical protein [Pseudomonas putida]
MKPSDLALEKDIFELRSANTPDDFNNTCLRAKARIAKLLEQGQLNLVSSLSKLMLHSFEAITKRDDAFILSVLHNFPINSKTTFSILNKSPEIDEYITSTKLVISEFDATEEKDFMPVMYWACNLDRQDVAKDIICQVVADLNSNHENQLSLKKTLNKRFIDALIWTVEENNVYPEDIDKIMADFSGIDDSMSLDDDVIHGLVRSNLHLTLMKLIEKGRFRRYSENDHTPSETEAFYAALPSSPTINELVAMHLYTDKPGLSEHILFDESVDLKQFINALKTSSNRKQSQFSITNMEPFVDVLTAEHVNTPARRKRVDFLFTELCDYLVDPEYGSYGSVADVKESMEVHGFDSHIFKVCKRFRKFHLEDELGM